MTRKAVETDLTDLIDNPDNVDQGQLNLCDPAATVRTILRRDPKLIADCAIQLVETREGKFGRRNIEPDSDLKNQTYQSKWGLGAAEWVLMTILTPEIQDTTPVHPSR